MCQPTVHLSLDAAGVFFPYISSSVLGQSWGMDWRGSDARLVHLIASADEHWREWLYAKACLALTVIT